MSSSSNWRTRSLASNNNTASALPSSSAEPFVTQVVGVLKLREIVDDLKADPDFLVARIKGAKAAGGNVGVWREAVTYAHSKIADLDDAIETARGWLAARRVASAEGLEVAVAGAVGVRVPRLGEMAWIWGAGEEELKGDFVGSVVEMWEKKGGWEGLKELVDAVSVRT